ncbi:MAG: cytochrome c biogenesis protein ResB [Angustibacter sp.]
MSGSARGAAQQAPSRLDVPGGLRFAWRQLTSMRTALFLLLLLAVAAVPGSVLPQRDVDPGAVSAYLDRHRTAGPWLDRVGGFDVYASVWFSAIYLLLFVSLVGCLGPRSRQLWRALRARPPRVPSRVDRLPSYRAHTTALAAAPAADRVRDALRRRRYRVDVRRDPETGGIEVSAERGYLREAGNLVFHLALVVVLVGVAYGHLLGWRGEVTVVEGQPFSNVAGLYDNPLAAGPWVDTERLPPFSITVDDLRVRFETAVAQRGAPREFVASVRWRADPGAPEATSAIAPNRPLHVGGASVHLLGNGYAPQITVRDGGGRVLYSEATVFPPQDGTYRSVGVVRAPGARPQLGLQGVLLPTAVAGAPRPTSVFPDALNPVLLIGAWSGDLGLGSSSPPRSVYQLDVSRMQPVRTADGEPFRSALRPGQTVQLPGDRGSVTFDRLVRFAALTVRHDPGKPWVLGGAVAAMLGLAASLFLPRRRVFVRVVPAAAAHHRPPDGALPGDAPSDDVRADEELAGGVVRHDEPGDGVPADAVAPGGRVGERQRPGAPTLVRVAGLARGEDTGVDDEIARVLAALPAAETTSMSSLSQDLHPSAEVTR